LNGDNSSCSDCPGTPNGPAWTDACGTCGNPPAPILWYKDTDGDLLGDPSDILSACTQPAGYVADLTDDNPDCSCASDSNCYDICGVCKTASNSLGTATSAQCTGNDWVSGTCQKDGNTDGNYTYDGSNDNAMDCAGVCLNGFNGGSYGATLGTYYADTDNDTWGDPATPGTYCSAGAESYTLQTSPKYVANPFDTNASVQCTTNLVDCNDDCCENVDEIGVCTDVANLMHTGVAECSGGTVSPAPSTQSACLAASGHWRRIGNNECGVCGGTVPTWYDDTDGDGLGNLNMPSTACTQPTGYVASSTDNYTLCNCSANNSTCYDSCSVCNGDNATCLDCAGTPNGPAWTDACGTCGNPPAPILWYKDTDGDSLGDPGDILAACTQPAGYVADFTDDNPDCSCASDSNCYDICGVCKTDSNSLGTATAAQCTGNDWVSGTCQKDGDGDGNYTYGGTNDNAMDCAGVCLNGFNGGTYGAVLGTYYSDTDVDGWGHPTTTGTYCSAGSEIVG
jgi:hypothetical protein